MFYYTRLERLARDKQSSVFGQIIKLQRQTLLRVLGTKTYKNFWANLDAISVKVLKNYVNIGVNYNRKNYRIGSRAYYFLRNI